MSSLARRLVTDEGDRKVGNPASSEKEKPFRISGQIVLQRILVVNRIACFLSEPSPKVPGRDCWRNSSPCKALDFSGCNSRPGTGSLHPVAIEAAAEATKLSELSMERVAWRLRERAGHNVSER